MSRLYATPLQMKQRTSNNAAVSIVISLGVFAMLSLLPGSAHAGFGQQMAIGQIATNIRDSLVGVSSAVMAICYVGALIFGYVGAMKFKAHGEQPDRTPFKVPLTYWGIAAVLAAIPEFIGSGIGTIWGGGATTVQPI